MRNALLVFFAQFIRVTGTVTTAAVRATMPRVTALLLAALVWVASAPASAQQSSTVQAAAQQPAAQQEGTEQPTPEQGETPQPEASPPAAEQIETQQAGSEQAGAAPTGPEPVKGEACYTYSQGETLLSAKHISISLAKRKALEAYGPFAEATANMQDPQLRNDLIANLTVRVLTRVEIPRLEEDAEKKIVCATVEAEVDPQRMKSQISAVYSAFRYRRQSVHTGLPENEYLRIIRIREAPCFFDQKVQCLDVVAECRRNSLGKRHPIRIIWYDTEGLPAFSIKRRVGCERPRDVENFALRLPPGEFTFKVDLP